MRGIITVTGLDRPGIVAAVAVALAHARVNIVDITQKTMTDFFTMIVEVDTEGALIDFPTLQAQLAEIAEHENLSISSQSRAIFDSMHEL